MNLETIKKEFDQTTQKSDTYDPEKQQEILNYLWENFVMKGIYPRFRKQGRISVFMGDSTYFCFSLFGRKKENKLINTSKVSQTGIEIWQKDIF